MTEHEHEIIDGYIRVFRQRIKSSNMNGEEFLNDFLGYLKCLGVELRLKDSANDKS